MRLLASLLIALCVMVCAPQLRAQPDGETQAAEAESEGAAKSAYDQHMDNGVKLYREGNYPAAIAEFEAAYGAEPKASPLINLALSYKKQFAYPRAIAVLEQALDKHQDTIKPEHKEAAEKEIRELKALLAWVTVKIDPASAELLVDGKPRKAGKIALSPGEHHFSARADGYKSAETRQTLTSGNNLAVALKLVLTTGQLSVGTMQQEAVIEVDGTQVGQANWKGLLPPGVHAVRIVHDGEAQQIKVFIKAGGKHSVQQLEDGTLKTDAPAPRDSGDKDKPDGPEEPEVLRGFYGTATAALLTALPLSSDFKASGKERFGGAGGLHLGYRVTDFAGFELIGQFSDIRVEGSVTKGDTTAKGRMTLSSGRVGGLIRIMAPGREFIRFVGTVGGGVLIEELEWNGDLEETFGARYSKESGVGGFVQLDLGVELEFSNILLGLYVQQTGQTTKHLDVENGENAFNEKTILVIGPQIRVGYSLW